MQLPWPPRKLFVSITELIVMLGGSLAPLPAAHRAAPRRVPEMARLLNRLGG